MLHVLAGILLPQSILYSPWFTTFAVFVGFNTIVYCGLTFSRLIPWPKPLSRSQVTQTWSRVRSRLLFWKQSAPQ